MRWFGILALLIGCWSAPAVADTPPQEAAIERPGRTGLPLPRFVSLRASEVNLRTGPGFHYPIEWVYRARNMPVEIIDEYDTWRRIRDWEGTMGWVHQSMLQGRRTLRVLRGPQLLRRNADESAAPVARLEDGALGELRQCRGGWCRVDFAGFAGWLPRDAFFGVYPQEEFD